MAVNTKIVLENTIDGYLAEGKDIKGAFATYETTAERDAVLAVALVEGSLCYVKETDAFYKWNGTSWEEKDIGGGVKDVKVNGGSVVTDKIANITVPTKTSELTNDSNYEKDTNKTDTLSESSTSVQYPNAKVTYDTIKAEETRATTKESELEEAISQAGKVDDVQNEDGTSFVKNKIATIPSGGASGVLGLFRLGSNGGLYLGSWSSYSNSCLMVAEGNFAHPTQRRSSAGGGGYGVVTTHNFDLAVKYALTDGVGTAYTTDEQTAARTRIGAASFASIGEATDVTISEDEWEAE